MASDGRTPVLVGCGQLSQRVDEPSQAREPLLLMEDVLRAAALDAGAPALLAGADSIRVCQGLWKYGNPAAWLGERFGCGRPETALGGISGTTVQSMLSDAACEIQAGRRDIVLLVGAETEHSKRRAKRAGGELPMRSLDGPEPERRFGTTTDWRGNPDVEVGLLSPPLIFALFEVAMRHRFGEDPASHLERIATLWHGFARIAARHPHAWVKEPPSVEEIATPSGANRMIVAPYTKYLVSNMVVDQAAALILTSTETADRLGIAEDRRVYPHAATEAVVVRTVSERETLAAEPPMRIVGQRALELVGTEAAELDCVDLYSCFPSAVQLGADALGLPLDGELSVTGGLTFHGGPFNSYVMHAIATMMERLRGRPGALGLNSSVGGSFSKHAFGIYGAAAPEEGFRFEDLAEPVAQLPKREVVLDYQGEASVETYAVGFSREGRPEKAIVACRTPADERAWGQTEDPDAMAALLGEDACGRPARIGPERSLSLG